MTSRKWGISLAALIAMTAQSEAATLCDPGAASALKTAAVQQELMVAGLTCNDTSAYNRFVLDFQPSLQKSDAALMSYFRNRDGSEAGYDSYKTKLANLAAGKSGADAARFCAAANRDFAAAAASGQTLDNFIHADRLIIAAPEACAIQYDVADVAVAGVPTHDMPALPYGDASSGPAPAPVALPPAPPPRPPEVDPDRRQAYNDLPRPPRYPREPRDDNTYSYSSAYGRPAYGPAYGSSAYGPSSYDRSAYGPPAYDPYQDWTPPPARRWPGTYYDD